MPEHIIEEREKEDLLWKECCNWCGGWKQHDKLDTIGWAAFFFWGAFVILAESTGYSLKFTWWSDAWGVFLAGAGVIVLVGTLFRLLLPEYRKGIAFGLIFGSILVGIGLGGWDLILPLLLAAMGISILIKAITTDRRKIS